MPLLSTATAMLALGLLAAPSASAADSPGASALEDYRTGKKVPKAIENRYFLKEGRFELAPHFGYVPNNPLAVRYVAGAFLTYHLNETISFGGDISYSPDLGEQDLKGLVGVLLDRAFNASANNTEFQQPLDKVTLSAQFGVNWAPIYGKINLLGETVVNFDFYLFAGAGFFSKTNYVAVYDPSGVATGDVVALQPATTPNEQKVGPVIGLGQNYFITQSLALKLDARSAFYVDNKPQYDPAVPVTEQRLVNNFTASIGLGVYFPAMKPRLYEF
ncbi:MAG: outer membrane beta-barrel domain-containing protein [Deltaproteobacteria bacterium]|nr:outer membrane beta-barrel domain-containing protein [Deltaproteobacteria bacterium]